MEQMFSVRKIEKDGTKRAMFVISLSGLNTLLKMSTPFMASFEVQNISATPIKRTTIEAAKRDIKLNGDMAQQFNDMQDDMEEGDAFDHYRDNSF